MNLPTDFVKAAESELPEPEHGQESTRRYPTRDRATPRSLDDYVTGKELDNAADDAANCTDIFCYRVSNVPSSTKMLSHPQSPVSGEMRRMKS